MSSDAGPRGVDLASALQTLRGLGVGSLLVEGGARVITSFFAEKLVDRLVVGIAPTIMGTGIDAVGDLGVARVAEGVRLTIRSVHQAGGDLLVAATTCADVRTADGASASCPPRRKRLQRRGARDGKGRRPLPAERARRSSSASPRGRSSATGCRPLRDFRARADTSDRRSRSRTSSSTDCGSRAQRSAIRPLKAAHSTPISPGRSPTTRRPNLPTAASEQTLVARYADGFRRVVERPERAITVVTHSLLSRTS